jgi:hypothetical protein
MIPDSFIIETVSNKWLRFPNGFQKATCLIDLPNDLALNINVKTGKIEVHSKKSDGIYKLVGHISMNDDNRIKRRSTLPIERSQFKPISLESSAYAWL